MPMTSAMNGALIMPDEEVCSAIAALQPRQEHLGADVAVEPGRQAAAEQRRDRRR